VCPRDHSWLARNQPRLPAGARARPRQDVLERSVETWSQRVPARSYVARIPRPADGRNPACNVRASCIASSVMLAAAALGSTWLAPGECNLDFGRAPGPPTYESFTGDE
jgi:hypothetical protein